MIFSHWNWQWIGRVWSSWNNFGGIITTLDWCIILVWIMNWIGIWRLINSCVYWWQNATFFAYLSKHRQLLSLWGHHFPWPKPSARNAILYHMLELIVYPNLHFMTKLVYLRLLLLSEVKYVIQSCIFYNYLFYTWSIYLVIQVTLVYVTGKVLIIELN